MACVSDSLDQQQSSPRPILRLHVPERPSAPEPAGSAESDRSAAAAAQHEAWCCCAPNGSCRAGVGEAWLQPDAPTGRGAWLQFLWGLVPVPFISFLFWLLGAIAAYAKLRDEGELAEANSRHALNWALTNVVVLGAIELMWLAVAISLSADDTTLEPGSPLLFLVWCSLLFAAGFALMALVNGFIGFLRAGNGEEFRGWPVIRFLRTPQTTRHGQ